MAYAQAFKESKGRLVLCLMAAWRCSIPRGSCAKDR